MKYNAPTYEEYCKATLYAKIRYRFGVYIQFIGVILFLFLLFYAIANIEEMKANPIKYAEEKLGVICYTPINTQTGGYDYGSNKNITSIREWG